MSGRFKMLIIDHAFQFVNNISIFNCMNCKFLNFGVHKTNNPRISKSQYFIQCNNLFQKILYAYPCT